MKDHDAPNEFDAVKSIVDALKGLDPKAQARALRYASEVIGINAPKLDQVLSDQLIRESIPQTNSLSGVDIKTFMSKKLPKSDVEFTAAVAYYYRFEAPEEQRRGTINAKVLSDAARLVGRRQPGNSGQTLRNTKNAGYLDAADEGSYRINAVGENLVAMALPKDPSTNHFRTHSRRRSRKGKGELLNRKKRNQK